MVSQSTLFFKSSPQITIAEMSGDLPSDDMLFNASTSAEFSEAVHDSTPLKLQKRSLKDLMATLLQENWLGPDDPQLNSLSIEQLTTLMFGSYTMHYLHKRSLHLANHTRQLFTPSSSLRAPTCSCLQRITSFSAQLNAGKSSGN